MVMHCYVAIASSLVVIFLYTFVQPWLLRVQFVQPWLLCVQCKVRIHGLGSTRPPPIPPHPTRPLGAGGLGPDRTVLASVAGSSMGSSYVL